MVCVHCGNKTQVVNSRFQKRANQVWRRRRCISCGAVFTTEELVRYEAAWTVHRLSGDFRPFSRDKLFLSLYRSLEHRKTAPRDAGALADTIIKKLASTIQNGTIETRTIKQTAQVALNRFDTAASVHYQAFHRT